MPCCYGYSRCSHLDSAKSGMGLEVQRRQIKDAADRLIEKRPELIWRGNYEDKIVSAYKVDLIRRPAGKALHEALQSGDVVIFAKMDRVFRSIRDFATMSALWKSMGVTPIFIDAGVDGSTPQGQLMLGMLALMAQFDSALKSERNKEIYALRKAAGKVRWRNTALHKNGHKQTHLLDRKKVIFARWLTYLRKHKGMTLPSLVTHVESTLARREERNVKPMFKCYWSHTRIEWLLRRYEKFRGKIEAMRLTAVSKLWIDGTIRNSSAHLLPIPADDVSLVTAASRRERPPHRQPPTPREGQEEDENVLDRVLQK